MPSPAPSIDPADAASSIFSSTLTPSRSRLSHAQPADMRDESNSDSDDDGYHDDGFDAAHAAYLARRIAEATADSVPHRGGGGGGGMSPFDESVIDHEWEELVKSMKAIVPTVAHFIGSSLGPTLFAAVCTWLGFKFHKVVLDRV